MIDDCVFCKIVSGKIPSKKLFEDENFLVIEDIHPVSKGHCLLISKKHFETILDFPLNLSENLVKILKFQSKRLIESGLADGVKIIQNNFEASGQSVKHIHFHIIPEKNGLKRESFV
jgi:histidine triad (HIT) family protein